MLTKARVVVQLAAALAATGQMQATLVETAGPSVVIAADTFVPGFPTSGTYYNASGVVVGNELLMFVQGGQWDANPGCPGRDAILLFTAPWTPQGVRSRFAYHGRISPCPAGAKAYGIGNVFFGRGKYNLIADETPDSVVFNRVVWFSSTNGKTNWTVEPFITHTLGSSFFFLDVVLYPQSNTTWWGFFKFGYNYPNKTGRLRVTFSWTGTPTYQVLRNGVWATLPKSGTEGLLSFEPDDVGMGFEVNDLFKNGATVEAWGHSHVPHNGCAPCPPGYDNGFAGTTFLYRSATVSSLGPTQGVYSCVRCLPSDSHVGRLFGFRVNGPDGKRLFYSSTNDQNICDPNLFSPFAGMYVVETDLDTGCP